LPPRANPSFPLPSSRNPPLIHVSVVVPTAQAVTRPCSVLACKQIKAIKAVKREVVIPNWDSKYESLKLYFIKNEYMFSENLLIILFSIRSFQLTSLLESKR
jgi:glycogen synthase